MTAAEMVMGAEISDCRTYRYTLTRVWDSSRPTIVWVMLNPSVADAQIDDAAIRRILDFSKRWGYGSLVVVNLFALRSTDPKLLRSATDPVGPLNDGRLLQVCGVARTVVAAWGGTSRQVGLADRIPAVLTLLRGVCDLQALGFTNAGDPRHPLYVSKDTRLQPMRNEP